MTVRHLFLPLVLLGFAACDSSDPLLPVVPTRVAALEGDGQTGSAGSALPIPLTVRVTDAGNNAVPGVTVTWSALNGGSVAPASATTNIEGVASATFTLGPVIGQQQAQAQVSGLEGSPVVFTATALAVSGLSVVAGGNNVPERYSSDLWVHGDYAYTGTWGLREEEGNQLKVWSLGASGAPTLVGSVTVPNIGTVSDLQVREDGQVLVLSGERGTGAGGIYLYDLSDPAQPEFVGSAEVGDPGVHTVTLSTIQGRHYAFAARNAGFSGEEAEDPALLIYDITDPSAPAQVARRRVPRNYGIHDTYVRDGIAFVFAWNSGVIIYDVGDGRRGGSPAAPVEITRMVTAPNGVPGGPAVHNGWWFHNPATGERRYLFVGQEGPSVIGSASSGDIHVVDVSDLANPREVAFFHLDGAGTHNFWMDEERQILYAAYYNGGVVALDVSGTLTGNLADRLVSQVRPGGQGNTFTWGVQLANGFLYAIDMISGLWQLDTD